MKLARQMRKLGWISFAALFVTVMAIFIVPDANTTIIPALLVGNIFLTIFLLLGSELPRVLAHRSLQRNGLPAEARILNIWETGVHTNDQPLVGMRLEVRPAGQPAFEAETEQIMSVLSIAAIQPGATVKVRYNPDNRTVTIVDE